MVHVNLINGLLSSSANSSLAEGLTFDLDYATTSAQALTKLADKTFDAILLDILLPDNNTIDIILKIKQNAPNTPIVIQTGSDDENLVVKAFQMGAHGYLRKKDLDRNLLIYAIRLAMVRQQYVNKLEQVQQEKEQDLELLELEQMVSSGKTSVTARMFGSEPLKESLNDIFVEMVQQYAHFLDLALEQRAYKVEHNISEQLRNLANKLGFLKASPRDVIDIHTRALRDKTQNSTVAKAQAYITEGRLMVLELMGYLTSYYRKYYIGLSNVNINIFPSSKNEQ